VSPWTAPLFDVQLSLLRPWRALALNDSKFFLGMLFGGSGSGSAVGATRVAMA
jgi:hypothetical protein